MGRINVTSIIFVELQCSNKTTLRIAGVHAGCLGGQQLEAMVTACQVFYIYKDVFPWWSTAVFEQP